MAFLGIESNNSNSLVLFYDSFMINIFDKYISDLQTPITVSNHNTEDVKES